MAAIFTDGFDKYGPTGSVVSTIMAGEWNQSAGSIVAGLSSTGYAFNGTGNRSLTGNYTRSIGGIRVKATLSVGLVGFSFVDGVFGGSGPAQFSILVQQSSGRIALMTSGLFSGTIIATSTASISANTTAYIEWDVTIGSSGAYNIYLNGLSILSGTGNTAGQGTTTYNTFAFGPGNDDIGVDDFYLFDQTGSTNNAVLLTNPRIETTFPVSDSQTQFTNGASIIGQAYTTEGGGGIAAPGANKLFLRRFQQLGVNATVASVSFLAQSTAPSANFTAVIYADSTGAPGALLSTGTQVTGTTTATVLTGALVTPQALTVTDFYWIGFICDSSISMQVADATSMGFQAANTYASGAPGTAPTMTAGQPSWVLWGNCTGATANYVSEDLNPPVGDYSYIYSNTVNNEDLYGFPVLSEIPSVIYSVAVKANTRKTDTGTRTANLQMKSSGTDSAGTMTVNAPSTSYSWMESTFETDPATGLPWAYATLNAATSGIKLVS